MSFDLLSDIQRRAEEIAQRGREIEEEGRLPQDILEWIYDLKLFKLMVPDEFGGRPTPLPKMLRIFDELSFLDGSLGWLVHIGAAGGYFAPSFEKETARRLFSPREAVIAGTGFPAGRARRVEGGYRVSGRWFYASGAQYATVFTASAVCEGDAEEDGVEKVRAFAFDRSQVEVIHDWAAFGLKGTASDTFVVRDVFVSDERVFTVGDVKWSDHEPLYRMPFDILAVTTIASVSIGLTRRFFDLAQQMPRWERSDEKERRLGEAEHLRDLFHVVAERAWSRIVQEKLDEPEQGTIIHAIQRLVADSVRAAQDVFSRLGMRALWEKEAINRVYRDLQTASQHFHLRG